MSHKLDRIGKRKVCDCASREHWVTFVAGRTGVLIPAAV